MSAAENRPVLRARRRTTGPNPEAPVERKRKSRPKTTVDDTSSQKKRYSMPADSNKNTDIMTLESREVLESPSFLVNGSINNMTNSSFNTSTCSIDSNATDDSFLMQQQKRRKSSRKPANKKSEVTNQKQITANVKQDNNQKRPSATSEIINGMTSFTFSNYFTPISKEDSPLPKLAWADSDELWEIMLQKDRDYKRDSLYIRKHPSLQPRMRAVLLDWLIEVCEVYRLHRETFHLAVDFVDRYLSTQRNIPKTRLQLVGITALFVAAKIEEIYPPKLAEFSYVTDGACRDEEILQQEILLLQALNWHLSPVTPVCWLTVYLQIANRQLLKSRKSQVDHLFDMPQFSAIHLVRVSELIDLCCLDTGYLQFSYSIIAASCLYHVWGKDVTEITGHKFEELFPCIQWLAPFSKVVQSQPIKPIKHFDKIPVDDAHNIQVHNNGVQLLDFVHAHMSKVLPVNNIQRTSPQINCKGLLTPPHSAEKS